MCLPDGIKVLWTLWRACASCSMLYRAGWIHRECVAVLKNTEPAYEQPRT